MALSRRRLALALASVVLGASCSFLFPTEQTVLTLTRVGGRFTYGPVTVTVPPNALQTDHTVNILEATGAPESARRVGLAVTVTLTPPDSLMVPATVEFRYADFTSPPRIPRASLELHRVEEGSWVSAGGANDAGTSVVSAEVTRFGDFALLGRRAEVVQAQSAATQPAQPNTTIATPPSVVVLDSAGAGLAGIAVSFAVTAGGGSISPASTVTDASGVATASTWMSGPAAGANAAVATVTELPAVTFTTTAAAGAPVEASVAVNAGDNQTAMVGSAVVIRPSVIVRDQSNAPFAGARVTFAVASGGGSLTGASQTTGANGIATVGAWTLGTTPGTNTLTVVASGTGVVGNPVTITATAQAGAAGRVIVAAGNGQVGAAGAPVAIPPSVQVLDQFNNPVQGVTVTFAGGIGGGAVSGGSQTTGSNGTATVGSWTLGGVVGTQTLTATVNASNIGGNPATVTATAQAGPPSVMAMNGGQGQSAAINTPVAVPPSVRVADQFANPVSGVPVMFAVTGTGGTLTGATPTTGLDGVARVGSWTLGPDAGLDSLTATSAGLTGSPVLFTANAVGGAATIAVNDGDQQSAIAGTAVSLPPSVVVLDQSANPVQGASVTFSVTGGGGSILGANQTTGANGVARVAQWTLGPTAGPNTLAATSSGLNGSPLTFTATGTPPPAATSIALNDGDAQSATIGTQVATRPSVIVRDQFSNPFPGANVTFAVTGGGGSIAGASQTTGSNGVARVGSWTLGPTAGINTLTATSASLAGSPVPFTATAVAPPPPGADEPADPGSGYLFADNFDRYASVIATLSPGNCPAGTDGYGVPNAYATYGNRTRPNSGGSGTCNAPSGYSLVTGRGGSGNAVSNHFVADPGFTQVNNFVWTPNWGSGGVTDNFSYASGRAIVIQIWFKGTGPGRTYAKWTEMWYSAAATNPQGRIQMGIWYTHRNSSWHVNGNGATDRIAAQPLGPYPEIMTDNQWHRMTIAYKPNSSGYGQNPSSRDGLFRAWIDGTKIIDLSASAIGVTPPGGTWPWAAGYNFNGSTYGPVDATGAVGAGLDWLPAGDSHQITFIRFPDLANGTTDQLDLAWDDLKIWTIP